MANNDSSTGGFIVPDPGAGQPQYDLDLERLFSTAFKGICGIADKMARPRWQPEPAAMPAFDKDWVAFAVSVIDQDQFAYEQHVPLQATTDPVGVGADVVEYDEVLELFASFYGPRSQALAQQFRAGLQVPQNRWQLQGAGIKLKSVGAPTYVPALLKEINVKRTDLKVQFTRRATRVYAIRDLADATAVLLTDNPPTTTPINVQP